MNKTRYSAPVIRGSGKGRKLGYPTANFLPPKHFRLKYGIYTAKVHFKKKKFLGILYWGTLGGTRESLEIHIFDFEGNLYGKNLSFLVGEFIREDRAMASEGELKSQIAQDIKKAKALV